MDATSSTVTAPVYARLADVAKRIDGLDSAVLSESTARRAEEDARIQLIRDAIAHLDRVLQIETHARQKRVSELSAKLNDGVEAIISRFDSELEAIKNEADEKLSALEKRLTEVEQSAVQAHTLANERRESTVNAAKNALEDLSKSIKKQQAEREEHEKALRSRVDVAVLDATARLDAERKARETAVQKLDSAIKTAIEEAKTRADESAKAIERKSQELNEALAAEKTARLDAERTIVATMDELVASVQQSVERMMV